MTAPKQPACKRGHTDAFYWASGKRRCRKCEKINKDSKREVSRRRTPFNSHKETLYDTLTWSEIMKARDND